MAPQAPAPRALDFPADTGKDVGMTVTSLKHGNLFLVGPMGAGKTTVGRELARQLRLSFHDSDHEIERRTGANISLIFDLEGEAGFRVRERNMIAELAQHENSVLATGGGAILDPANRTALAAHGTVIYLHAPVEHLLKRIGRDTHRPLMQTEHPRARLEHLMRERDPLYREIADLVIETHRRRTPSVVSDILRHLRTRPVPIGVE